VEDYGGPLEFGIQCVSAEERIGGLNGGDGGAEVV
jgi:hypothetical protein